MSKDIVAKLRAFATYALSAEEMDVYNEAANEIERLRKELSICGKCGKRSPRINYAQLVRETSLQSPLFGSFSARGALEIAARAIERGRHLTSVERRENLWKALKEADNVPK